MCESVKEREREGEGREGKERVVSVCMDKKKGMDGRGDEE